MSSLLRRLYGVFWIRLSIVGDDDGGDGGGDGGGEAAPGAGDDAGLDQGSEAGGDDTAALANGEDADQGGEKDPGKDGLDLAGNKKPPMDPDANLEGAMLSALKQGLGYDKKPDTKADDATKAAAKTPEQIAAEAAAAAGKKPAAGADPKAKPPAKVATNPLYQMPENLGPQARERFKGLTEGHKAVSAELETARTRVAELEPINEQLTTQRDSFREMLEETETTTDALNGFLTYNAHLKAKNWRGAHAILAGQLRQLELQSGEEFGDVDPLDDFPDLQEEVANHQISKERAMEIVRTRQDNAVRQGQNEQRQATETANNKLKQEQDTQVQNIARYFKQVAGKDIDYKVKEAKLAPKIQAIFARYPVNQWLQAVQDAYDAIEAPPSGLPVPKNRPLRPSGGGGRPAPTNSLEAVKQGLGYE